MRWPTLLKRPSFLMSRWMISPGFSRSYRGLGSCGSRLESRLRPRRCEDARDAGLGDVELGGDVLLGAALTAQSLDGGAVASGIWLGDERGFEERSRKPTTPSALKRATHLATVFGVVLNWRAACSLAQPVVHNGADHVLSTFGREASIVVGVHSVPRRIVEVWRHQRSRSGPNGQPPESSQLVWSTSRKCLVEPGRKGEGICETPH